jgi:GNAT superfamily N-acetyltransferase
MGLIYKLMSTEQELADSIYVVRQAFATVAEQFSLTVENAPTNPAFIEIRHLQRMREKSIVMIGVFCEDVQVGFVAIERKDTHSFYLERLAVLPQYRHKGYGRKIVEYAAACIANQGGKSIVIGMIDSHTVLKTWYHSLGFQDLEVKHHPHLPFPVCYMEKRL